MNRNPRRTVNDGETNHGGVCVQGAMDGRIGGMLMGFDIHVTTDGHRIHGRMGGGFKGKDVDLEFDGTNLIGRWGGVVDGKDVHCTLQDNTLTGHFGGIFQGRDLTLVQQGNQISGHSAGVLSGMDIAFELDPDGHMAGRLQGFINGKDLDCTVSHLPPLIAAALAVATCWELFMNR